MSILNLTQHNATQDQKNAGVVDMPSDIKPILVTQLTFDTLPTRTDIFRRAEIIADLAVDLNAKQVMIGGAPYLMTPLADALKLQGIDPLYAFSQRVSVEEEVNGEVVKRNVFKHLGFVDA